MARKTETPQQQTFRFSAPDATSVLLVGDFTHWQKNAISMEKGEDGVWETTPALSAGRHTYRFIVDGQWRDDPECTVRVANPFGTQDMVRQVA